jgi:hypothetical protein
MRNPYSAGVLYACKGHVQTLPRQVRTPSLPVREREIERERVRKREGGREGERERERERERKMEGESEKERERLFIFKRNDGCLGTF